MIETETPERQAALDYLAHTREAICAAVRRDELGQPYRDYMRVLGFAYRGAPCPYKILRLNEPITEEVYE